MAEPSWIDRAWQGAYWLGYRLARQWWRLRRPDQHGAVVAIWLDGRVLAVRQSYRPGIGLPGGTIRPGEDEAEAARRELREELALDVAPGVLRLACRITLEWEYRQDNVRIFELHLTQPPVLSIDNREIIAARFMEPAEMLTYPMAPFLRAYLQGDWPNRA